MLEHLIWIFWVNKIQIHKDHVIVIQLYHFGFWSLRIFSLLLLCLSLQARKTCGGLVFSWFKILESSVCFIQCNYTIKDRAIVILRLVSRSYSFCDFIFASSPFTLMRSALGNKEIAERASFAMCRPWLSALHSISSNLDSSVCTLASRLLNFNLLTSCIPFSSVSSLMSFSFTLVVFFKIVELCCGQFQAFFTFHLVLLLQQFDCLWVFFY